MEPQQISRECIYAIQDEEIIRVQDRIHAALGLPSAVPAELVELFDALAIANVSGWIAYGIYDDFLDGSGEPRLLPAANFFLRDLTLQYTALSEKIPGLLDGYIKIMDTEDGANTEEILFYLTEAGDRDGGATSFVSLVCRSPLR